MASLIYCSPLFLGLMLRIKYGRYYHFRLKKVAQQVPEGTKVIDLCCGDSAIYFHHLRKKRVDYLGIEINPRMARVMCKKGVKVIGADVRTYDIPPCDVLLCLASLYQFSNYAFDLLRSAQQVADKIILLEPVENLASSGNLLVASIAARMTDFGEGPISFRFQEEELVQMWSSFGFNTIERVGPELMGVWHRSVTGAESKTAVN